MWVLDGWEPPGGRPCPSSARPVPPGRPRPPGRLPGAPSPVRLDRPARVAFRSRNGDPPLGLVGGPSCPPPAGLGSPAMQPPPNPTPSRRELLAGAAGAALAGCAGAERSGPSAAPAPQPQPRVDGLFADLVDESASIDPIQPAERADRRARLGSLLAARGLDAFLCEGGPTMTYLTGFGWGRSERLFALIVLADGGHFWLCPSFEAERARLRLERAPDPASPGGEIVTWHEDEYAWAPLAAALGARRAERVALDPQARFFIATGLAARPRRRAVARRARHPDRAARPQGRARARAAAARERAHAARDRRGQPARRAGPERQRCGPDDAHRATAPGPHRAPGAWRWSGRPRPIPTGKSWAA